MILLLQWPGGLTLAEPWLLLVAAPLLPALWWQLRRGEPALPFAPAPLAADLPRSPRVRVAALPRWLQIGALLLAALALAHPVRRFEIAEPVKGIDVYLCLDTSSSMAANDLDPDRSRLEVAKSAAAKFVAGRPADRIGLITFARYPDVACPPTLDHDALRQVLARVKRVEANGEEDATAIGAAVARAAQLLRGGTGRSKVVIALSDGAENVAAADAPEEIAPLHAAQLCRNVGVRAYAIGAGLGQPDASGGFVPLDTSEIERMADASGGAFFPARDADALARVYAEIDRLERAELPRPRIVFEDRFVPFVAAAIALAAVALLLRASPIGTSP